MLFNSPEFVLGFLPLALAGFFLAGRVGGTHWALRWLGGRAAARVRHSSRASRTASTKP